MTRDVVDRLIHGRDESTEVRSLLEAGASDDVGDYDFDRGLETHLAAIAAIPGGGAAGPSGAAPAGHSAAGVTSAKALALAIGLPLASLSAIAAVVLITRAPSSSAPAHPVRTPSAMVEAENPTVRAGEAEVAALPPQSPARMTDTAHHRAVARPEKVTLAEEAPLPQPPTADSRSGIVRDFPNDPPKQNSATTPAPAVVAKEEPRPTEEALAHAERAREEARRDAENKLQREMEELMQAKRALSSNPKLALELAERGQREFRQSLLSEEREHVLLLALIAVGRVSEAERRAEPYLQKHPDSPFARRVRAALEARKARKLP